MKTSIQFINHASVVVSDGNTSVLSDPWYTGDAFHKGWNLLHETSTQEVLSMLDAITHIWISHEHPDHSQYLFLSLMLIKSKTDLSKYFFRIQKISEFLSSYLHKDSTFKSWISISKRH